MTRQLLLLIGFGGIVVFGSIVSNQIRRPLPNPTAREINQAIFESEQRHYDAVLPSKIEAAQNNPRELSRLWLIATTYNLPKHAQTADLYLSTILLAKAEGSNSQKHITKLMRKAPEGSETWLKLKEQRDMVSPQ
jgi:hypothetical protein